MAKHKPTDHSSLSRPCVFLLLHCLLPLGIIIFFQHIYFLNAKVIIYHLIAIVFIYGSITIASILLVYLYNLTRLSLIKYSISLLWGSTAIFLYAVYLMAFIGKNNNSRIFTFDILFGYLKNVNTFAQNTDTSLVVVYMILLIIPLAIIALYFLFNRIVYGSLLCIQQFTVKIFTGHVPFTQRLLFMIMVFLAGSMSGAVFYGRDKFKKAGVLNEEPLLFIASRKYQGMFLAGIPENKKVRQDYPKNIPFNKKNIVLIIVDALRADHLGLYGYQRNTSPFLDSLYHTGDIKKVNIAIANAGGSFPGVLSIIRSKSWHNMSEWNFSLPDLLKDQGYDINFLISGDHTHFYDLKSHYGDSFSYYLDGGETKKYSINDDRLIFEGLDNIPSFKNKSAYFQIHMNSVHLSGKRMPENKLFLPDKHNKAIVQYYINNYDNGIVQADRYIKKIFAILKIKGYLQNSIVVITADHGEALGERGELGHSKNIYADHTLIPLLIYDTGNVKYLGLDFAVQTDIAPTIIDRLGLPIPESWEGYSLLKLKPDTYTFHQMNGYYAIVHRKGKLLYKYIYNKNTGIEELYELRSDLHEKHNLIHLQNKAYIDSLRQICSAFNIGK